MQSAVTYRLLNFSWCKCWRNSVAFASWAAWDTRTHWHASPLKAQLLFCVCSWGFQGQGQSPAASRCPVGITRMQRPVKSSLRNIFLSGFRLFSQGRLLVRDGEHLTSAALSKWAIEVGPELPPSLSLLIICLGLTGNQHGWLVAYVLTWAPSGHHWHQGTSQVTAPPRACHAIASLG